MSLSGFAGGASEALTELLRDEFMKMVQRKQLAQGDRRIDEDARQFDVTAGQQDRRIGLEGQRVGLDREKFGEDRRQFDISAGQRDRTIRLDEEAQPVRLGQIRAQTAEIERQPTKEQQEREFITQRDKTNYGYDVGKIRLQGDQQARIATIRQPTGLRPAQALTATRSLQNDYRKVMSAPSEMQRQLGIMEAGLEAARRGDLNAGSQAVLVTFQKILDPTSVVRESEYARTPEGLGLMQRIEGIMPRLAQGGPGVPASELETFAALARTLTEGVTSRAQQNAQSILELATEYGIDPKLITGSGAAPSAGGGKLNPDDLLKKYGGG